MFRFLFFLLSGPVLLIATIIFYASALNPSQQQIIKETLLSKIPFINQFFTTQTQTKMFNVQFKDVTLLKTEVFSVDYLIDLSLKTNKGETLRYLALYPFVVESVLDLQNPNTSIKDKKRYINYPSPKIQQATQDNKRDNIILRGSLNVSWESYLKPIKIALTKKAEIEALHSGILTKAQERSQQELQKLVDEDTIVNVDKAENNIQKITPPHLGITSYVQKNENIHIKPAKNRFDAILFKDDQFIGGVKFSKYNQIDKFDESNTLQFNFFDTNHPNIKQTRVLFYNDESIDAEIIYQGKQYAYTNSRYSTKSQSLHKNIKHNLIELALNTVPEHRDGEAEYCDYRENVINAVYSLINNKINLAKDYINKANAYSKDMFTSILLNETYELITNDKPIQINKPLNLITTFMNGIYDQKYSNQITDDLVSKLLVEFPNITEQINYLIALKGENLVNAKTAVYNARNRLAESSSIIDKQTFLNFNIEQRANYILNNISKFRKDFSTQNKKLLKEAYPQHDLYTIDSFTKAPYCLFAKDFIESYIYKKKWTEQDILNRAYAHNLPKSVSVIIFLKIPGIWDKYSVIGFDKDRWYVIPDFEEDLKDKDGKCYYVEYSETNMPKFQQVNVKIEGYDRTYNNWLFYKLMDLMKEIFRSSITAESKANDITLEIKNRLLFHCE